MALDEPAVATLAPAVQRHAVLPRADVQPLLPYLVRRDAVGDAYGRVGRHRADQPVDAIEHRSVLGRDRGDVVRDRVGHQYPGSPGSRIRICSPSCTMRGTTVGTVSAFAATATSSSASS